MSGVEEPRKLSSLGSIKWETFQKTTLAFITGNVVFETELLNENYINTVFYVRF